MRAPFHKSGRAGWLLGLFLTASPGSGQASGPHHSNPILVPDDPSGFDLTWYGELDAAYFVQFSTDLTHWEYLDFSHRGQDQLVPFWYDCDDSATAMYLRIRWMANAPVGDADGDGASDDYEVGVLGSDPLVYEEDVKYLVDLDGDGIIDLDETTLGLDPNTADQPGSDEIAQAGPLLLTQVYESVYLFSEVMQAQGAPIPGTWTQQFWSQPTLGGTILQPVPLADFRQANASFEFPLDGEGLSRKFSFTDRLKNWKQSISLGMTHARVDPEPSGQAVNRWFARQSAHMVKLAFPAEKDEDFPFLEIPTYSVQETLTAYQRPRLDGESDRDYQIRLFGITGSGVEEAGVTLRTMTVPAGQRSSNILEVRPDVELVPAGNYRTTLRRLIPVLKAPEVLAVNSDFDEGRIDPTTGYAIPDCDDIPDVDRKTGSGNSELRLDTERDHLDGLYLDDERVTDDLHPGWFGIHPTAMPDHFWDGAEVTIRKLDRLDPDTGRPESGQVRFYAKWGDEKFGDYYGIEPYDFETLDPVNLVTRGINKKPSESVYGSASQIPDNAQFWMEGVRPGKITLEWRLKKGTIDVAYEQTFLVATQQTKLQWQMDLRYLIRLQTHDDPLGYHQVQLTPGQPAELVPYGSNEINVGNYLGGGFSYTDNIETMSEYYDYYRQCWDTDRALDWAGLARTVGCQVIAGLSDLQYGIEDFSFAADIVGTQSGLSALTADGFQQFQYALFHGGYLIFDDLAWQHEAFLRSGFHAIDYVYRNDNGDQENLKEDVLSAWEIIAEASARLLNGDSLQSVNLLLIESGRKIANQEQNRVIQPAYVKMGNVHNGLLLGATGPLSPSPFDGCVRFTAIHGGTENIGSQGRRWEWVESGLPNALYQSDGVIKAWSLKSDDFKQTTVMPLLAERGKEFSRILPILGAPIKVADHLEAPRKQ